MPVFNSSKPPLLNFIFCAISLALLVPWCSGVAPVQALPLDVGGATPQDALQAAQNAMDKNSNSRTIVDFASLCFAYGDRNLARKLFQKAVNLDPQDWRAHLGLGQCQAFDYSLISRDKGADYPRRELELAKEQINLAAIVSSGVLVQTSVRYVAIGDAYMVLHDYKQALANYQIAKRFVPSGTVTAWLLTHRMVKTLLALGRLEQALPLCEPLLTGPIDDDALLSDIFKRLLPLMPVRDLRQIAPTLTEHLIQDASHSPQLFLDLGSTLEALKVDQSALICLEQANRIAPRDTGCALALARFYYTRGQKQKALQVIRKIERLNLSGEPGIARTLKAKLYVACLQLMQDAGGDLANQVRTIVRPTPPGNASGLALTTANLSQWKCTCKMVSMHMVLMHKTGVDYAHIQFADEGIGSVIYDPALTDPSKIWSGLESEVKVKISPQIVKVDSFADLARAILQVEAASYEPSVGIYNFDAPPLSAVPLL